MSRRISLPDFLGKEDSDINALFSDETEENNKSKAVRRILLKVIENELTERQKQVINLYYFKNMNTVSIADMLGIHLNTANAKRKEIVAKIAKNIGLTLDDCVRKRKTGKALKDRKKSDF